MSAKPAAIPFFGDAYLADTTHLTTEEHGAYFLLLLAAWRQDGCDLPDDDKKLARIVGMTTRKWKGIKATMLEFWQVENGRIFQARLRKEHAFACKKSETNRKAANTRWKPQRVENKQSDPCERISERNAPPPPPPIVEERLTSLSARDECDRVIKRFNEIAAKVDNPRCAKLTPKRLTACKARLRDDGAEQIMQAIEHIPKSRFLTGQTGDWRGADIDFLLRPDSVTKILEGKYDDKPQFSPSASGPADKRDGVARALDRRLGLDHPAGTPGRYDARQSREDREVPPLRIAAMR